jgi:hypothetical protein
MKIKNTLIAVIVSMGFMLFTHAATAATNASFLYNETDLENGYWKYDYTFANLSTNNEYLYGVQLYFGDHYDIGNTQPGGAWGMISTTSFLGTHSSNYANDIAAKDSQSSFSFTIDNQIGNISYAAFFDDHSGSTSYTTGTTASGTFNNDSPVAPEPVSTVLFLSGGATMAFMYRQKRKRQLS